MNKAFLTLLLSFLLFSGTAFSQENTGGAKPEKQDMLLLDFNWNTLLNTPDSVKVGAASWGFGAKLMYEIPMQNNFSFAFGGGISTANYYSNARINTAYKGTDSTYSHIDPIGDSISYKRNKLSITYGDIPVEIRYRSKPNEKGYSWKLAFGGVIGYHFQTHNKYIADGVKQKFYDFPNYKKWRYGLTFRASYGKVGVNAFYSGSNLFEDNKGDTAIPFSVGITLAPF